MMRFGRTWGRWRRAAALGSLAATLAACGAPPAIGAANGLNGGPASAEASPSPTLAELRADPQLRLEGEYGLWARHEGDRLMVSWVTREPSAGFLRVLEAGRVVEEVATPAGDVHTAGFRAPRGETIVLQYGSAVHAEDRHETTLYLGADGRRALSLVQDADSIYFVADVHGEYENLVRLLRNARLIDAQGRWSGGGAHLVMLGDYFSRGPDVTRLLWFLYELEHDAARRGGHVHLILGNHEIMAVTGDVRYLSPKEAMLAQLHGVEYPRLYDIDSSVLGRWLAGKPAVLRLGRVLVAHGGVTTDYLGYTVPALQDSLAAYMREDLFRRWFDTTAVIELDSATFVQREDFFWGPNSVFWFRGYVQSDTLGAELHTVLEHFESDLHVVGHTPIERIENRYDGWLIAAHPRVPATELLLLVREGDGYRRYRYGLTGPPEPLPPAPPAATRPAPAGR